MIAFLVGSEVAGAQLSAVRLWRDDRQSTAPKQVFAKGVTVISLVGEQGLWFGHGHVEQRGNGPVIRHFAACQDEPKRASLTVTAGVDFGRKAAAASTKAFLTGPPLAPQPEHGALVLLGPQAKNPHGTVGADHSAMWIAMLWTMPSSRFFTRIASKKTSG